LPLGRNCREPRQPWHKRRQEDSFKKDHDRTRKIAGVTPPLDKAGTICRQKRDPKGTVGTRKKTQSKRDLAAKRMVGQPLVTGKN